MGNKYDNNSGFVIGIYQENGRPAHALIRASNSDAYVGYGPFMAACGAVSGIQHDNPWAEPITMSDISKVTCKRCLAVLKHRGIIIPKEDKAIELLGTYNYNDNFPIHALIKLEPKVSHDPNVDLPPLRSVCNSYPAVYRSDTSLIGNKAIMAKVTCKNCLELLRQSGLVPQSTSKKFFLVEYYNGEIIKLTSVKDLKEEVKNHCDVIAGVSVIDSYETLRIKKISILIDKNGNEITERDL